jgi:hypothetical protein
LRSCFLEPFISAFAFCVQSERVVRSNLLFGLQQLAC